SNDYALSQTPSSWRIGPLGLLSPKSRVRSPVSALSLHCFVSLMDRRPGKETSHPGYRFHLSGTPTNAKPYAGLGWNFAEGKFLVSRVSTQE
ncbi:hypothetical protein BaRGS_00013531, partial [Batillaria attramentaria]